MRYCEADRRCRAYDRQQSLPGWSLSGVLCEPCLEYGSRCVRSLGDDWAALDELPPSKPPAGEIVGGSRERPIPINLEADALKRQIRHVVTTWEEILGGSLQHRIPELANHPEVEVYPTGCEDPVTPMAGWAALLLMCRLHERAERLTGTAVVIDYLPGRCHSCHLDTLRRNSGTDVVFCGNCRYWCDWDAYSASLRLESP